MTASRGAPVRRRVVLAGAALALSGCGGGLGSIARKEFVAVYEENRKLVWDFGTNDRIEHFTGQRGVLEYGSPDCKQVDFAIEGPNDSMIVAITDAIGLQAGQNIYLVLNHLRSGQVTQSWPITLSGPPSGTGRTASFRFKISAASGPGTNGGFRGMIEGDYVLGNTARELDASIFFHAEQRSTGIRGTC